MSRALVIAAADNRRSPGSSRYRFRRENRLLNAAAFAPVFKSRSRSRDKWFTVICRANLQGVARLGLAVSRKHCRRATARNRIKRIVRESFRQHQAELTGLDVVVINQPAAGNGSNRQLFDSLSRHWQQCVRTERQERRREGHDG